MKPFLRGVIVGVSVPLTVLVVGIVLVLQTSSTSAGTTVEPVILLDHPRVRVTRLILRPGQSTKQHTHKFDEVVICLGGSKLRTTSVGPEPERQTHYPEAGAVFMPDVKGSTHTLTNVGTDIYKQIAIALKDYDPALND